MGFGDHAHSIDFFGTRFDPSSGTKCPVITRRKLVARFDVVVKKTAVIDHPRDDFRSGLLRGRKAETTGPRLERIENDHGPIDQTLKSFEAKNEVERKSVCRSRGNTELAG